jgi:repressor LexA
MGEDLLSQKSREAMKYIRDWVMENGSMPSTRQLMIVMGYKSPRSTMLLMEELASEGLIEKKEDGSYRFIKDLGEGEVTRTVSVPLVGFVAAGSPILAEQNIEAMIPVSTQLVRPNNRYFLLKVKGDSMNLADINDGDLILVRQQLTAENGNIVVALIDDEATVKEFYRKGDIVMLIPRSTNSEHQPIIGTYDLKIQGLMVAVIPKIK